MSPLIIIATISIYIAILFAVAFIAERNTDNAGYFSGNRRMSWWMTATAMISAAMSGVTFISVPGSVATSNFSYLQMVVGFIIGYAVIAYVLVPIYYRFNVTSLYEYLEKRFGIGSHRTGAWLFLISRTLIAALRAYVVCAVLQLLVFDHYNIPFAVNASIFMIFVLLYSYRGGVRTIVHTDILRTFTLVSCLILSILMIVQHEGFTVKEAITAVADHPYSRTLFTDDWNDSRHLIKQLLAGIFMVVAMTGLDQDMMQRTLSCRTKRDAQKNLMVGILLQAVVILLFLTLGVLLYIYLQNNGIAPTEDALFPMFAHDGTAVIHKPDHTFPYVATSGILPISIGILFILGLVSSTFSSAGSALTALTTSFTVDILRGKERFEEKQLTKVRKTVNIGMAVALTIIMLIFDLSNSESIINTLYSVASYTYGPLLGMYIFGICSKRAIHDKFTPIIAITAPLICLILNHYSEVWFNGYQFGFEILIINAIITIVGLITISHRQKIR